MNRNRSGRAPVAPGGELALLAAADGSYALVREQASTADLHLAIFAQAPGLEVGRPGSCGPATAASPVSALALPTRVRIKSQPPLLARIKTVAPPDQEHLANPTRHSKRTRKNSRQPDENFYMWLSSYSVWRKRNRAVGLAWSQAFRRFLRSRSAFLSSIILSGLTMISRTVSASLLRTF